MEDFAHDNRLARSHSGGLFGAWQSKFTVVMARVISLIGKPRRIYRRLAKLSKKLSDLRLPVRLSGSIFVCAALLGTLSWAGVPGQESYTYDALGRIVTIVSPDGTKSTYNYDAAGNRLSIDTGADVTPPSAPTGLSAAAPTSTQVNLTWSASTDSGGSGLVGYHIYRNGSSTALGSSTGTAYADSTTSGTTAYTYIVKAYDGAGNISGPSNTASITTPDTIAPTTPTNLSAAATSQTQISLSWGASTDSGGSLLAGYHIYRGGSLVGSTASLSYGDSGLTANTGYSYTVQAYDHANNLSPMSNTASATTFNVPPPSTPTGLAASAVSQTQINLSWGASTDTGGPGLAGYHIYRGGSLIASTASTSTSYPDTGLSGYTAYSYTVQAYDTAGHTSAMSSAAGATTPDQTAPSQPTGLTASAISSTQINLSWSPSTDTGGSGLAGYKITRNGASLPSTMSTSYSDTGLAASTPYTYTVAAYDNAGNTSAASGASATTQAPPVGTFSLVSATHSNYGFSGDVASATVKNSGTGTITNISPIQSCGSAYLLSGGGAPSSLAPGASFTISCVSYSATYALAAITATGTNASNSGVVYSW
jgi:YD repeat-containing protein